MVGPSMRPGDFGYKGINSTSRPANDGDDDSDDDDDEEA